MNNFTPRAQQSLALARKQAETLKHNHVGTEHLLLGILIIGQGTAVSALENLGIDLKHLRKELEAQASSDRGAEVAGNIPFTPRVKKVLALAGKEAKAFNHAYVGTEHILLGIIREGGGTAARLLKGLGLDSQRTQDEVRKLLDPNFTPVESEGEQPEVLSSSGPKAPALRAFGRDLTAKARQGELRTAGRERDVDRIVRILARNTRNSPVLIGAPRIGKTSVIHALAESMVNGRWRFGFGERRIVQLDIPLIVAGAKYRGQMEERIMTIVREVRSLKNVILVIDDLPTVVNDEMEYGVFSHMRSELSGGELQCIFTAHEEEFYAAMQKRRWLESLIQPVLIESTHPDATLEILKAVRPKLEMAHKVKFTDEALNVIMELSDLYFVPRCQPANALEILDEAGSMLRFETDVQSPDCSSIELEVERIRVSKENAIKAQDFEMASSLRDVEKQAKDKLEQTLSEWRDSRQSIELIVGEMEIYRFVSERSGIEQEKLKRREQLPQQFLGSSLSGTITGVPKYERLQTESVLQGHTIEIERGTGFVLMPHTDEFRAIFDYAIKPAMDENGVVVKKAEDIYKPGSILAQVWDRIRKAEVILADLTGKNPNVILELGLCYGIERCPILLVRNAEDVPFNLRNLRYIEYENSAKGSEDLKRKLTSTVAEFIAQVRTPVK